MSIIQYLEDDKPTNRPLSTDLFEKIREDILVGDLAKGEKLTELKICNQYDVSRTPVREALRQLEAEGLIETIPNRGAFVVGLSEQDIGDFFTLRTMAEVQAVRWASRRMDEHEIEELNETFEFMEFYTMKNDIPKMLNINLAFHQIIYQGCHNRKLIQDLTLFQEYLKHLDPSNYYAPNYLHDVLSEHRDIYDAIISRDEEAAAHAMERHMANSTRRKIR